MGGLGEDGILVRFLLKSTSHGRCPIKNILVINGMNYKGFHFPIQHRAVALVLALVFALNIQAQKAAPAALQSTENSNEIVGTILDRDTKLPLEFSTVSLFSKKDSSLLTGTTTIDNGSFLLKTCHHDFFIKI
jgi:hypothetical protein